MTRLIQGLMVVTLASALLISGCGRQEADGAQTPMSTGHHDAASQAAQDGWPEIIRFGLIPAEGGTDTVERFAPMIDFIEDELGVPVEPKGATEYIGVITAMRNKQIEFAYYGPKSYTEAANIAGAEAIVRELNADGEEGYRSIIIARIDSGMKTLEDAQGKDFAFVTPNSTSGYLVPTVGIFTDTGMSPDAYFGNIQFTGSHGNAIQSVLRGDVPVAATNDLDLRSMARSGNADDSQLAILWTSDLIPSSPIAARGDIPESLKAAMRDAIVKFSSERPEDLAEMGRGGFVPAQDSDYDVTRLLEQRRVELEARNDG